MSKKAEGFPLRFVLINTGNISQKVLSKVLRSFVKNFERLQKPYPILSLTDDEKRKIIDEIRAFYLDVRGEEIGIIQEQQILDLFMETLAPIIYNQALDDAFKWYKAMSENLESDYYSLYKDV